MTSPVADTPVLEVRGLSRYFGSRVALENVSFSLPAGRVLAVLGGNGAGKSTLLAVIAGHLSPSRGEMSFLSKSSRRLPAAQRSGMAYSAERPMLYEDLQIQEALTLIAKAFGREGLQRLPAALEEFELGDLRTRLLRECSQGVRRRASLARAYLASPKLWLLDEPFVHLDWRAQDRLLKLLKREREHGAAILLAAHEANVVREFSEHFICLDQGRLRTDLRDTEAALAVVRGERPR